MAPAEPGGAVDEVGDWDPSREREAACMPWSRSRPRICGWGSGR